MDAKSNIQSQLSAYLDGELDESPLRQVEEALEADGQLRQELADLAAARKLLRNMPPERPGIDLVARVLEEAERNQLVGAPAAQVQAPPKPWMRCAATAAVLLVAATVGMIIAATLFAPGPPPLSVAREDNSRSGGDGATITARDARDGYKGRRRGTGTETGRSVNNERARLYGNDGRLKEARGRLGATEHGKWKESRAPDIDNGSGIALKVPPVTRSKARSHEGIVTDEDLAQGQGVDAVAVSGTVRPAKPGRPAKLGKSGGGGNGTGNAALTQLGTRNGSLDATFSNVTEMSRLLSGRLGDNEVIYTDRLELTQRQVETVLASNGISAMIVNGGARQSKGAQVDRQVEIQAQARGNFYVSNSLSPAQVQYEAYVTPSQMVKVQTELNRLRAKQNVSQDVPALVLADTAGRAEDSGWAFSLTREGEEDARSYKKAAERKADLLLGKIDSDGLGEAAGKAGDRIDQADKQLAADRPAEAPAVPAAVTPKAPKAVPTPAAPAPAEAKPGPTVGPATTPPPKPKAQAPRGEDTPKGRGAAPRSAHATAEKDVSKADTGLKREQTGIATATEAPRGKITAETVPPGEQASTAPAQYAYDRAAKQRKDSPADRKLSPAAAAPAGSADRERVSRASGGEQTAAIRQELSPDEGGQLPARAAPIPIATQPAQRQATVVLAPPTGRGGQIRARQDLDIGEVANGGVLAGLTVDPNSTTQTATANLRRLIITLNFRRMGDEANVVDQAATELKTSKAYSSEAARAAQEPDKPAATQGESK